MSVATPPPLTPPEPDELEALIREARSRQRRRRILVAIGIAAVVGGVLGVRAAVPGGSGVRNAADGGANGATIRQIENAARRSFVAEMGSSGGVTWADNGSWFWLTTNGGRSWRVAVPPHIAASGDPVARINQVEFVDRRNGWISADDLGGVTTPGDLRHWEIDRTADGGRTWQWSVPAGCLATCWDGSMSFVDARHGYVLAHRTDGSELFSTSDGGRSWEPVARLPWFGSITFVDRRDGVVTNGQIVRRTTDGGRQWTVPRQLPTFRGPIRSFGRRVIALTIRPLARGGRALPARLVAYMSADAGGHWQARVAPKWVRLGAPDFDYSIVTPTDWIDAASGRLYVTSDAGRDWRIVRPADLPPGWNIWSVDFTSPLAGWAIFVGGFGAHGVVRSVLVRTTDGGVRWSAVGPSVPKPKPLPPAKPACGSSCSRP